MAIDKAVDSAALDSALTDIADAIRAKTGGADPLTLEQMPSEIEGIQSGGAELERKVTSFKYAAAAPDTEFVAELPLVTSLSQTFMFNARDKALKKIDITVTDNLTDMHRFAMNCYSLTEVILRGNLSKVTNYSQAFAVGQLWRTLKTVKGLDFTSATNVTGIFSNQRGLTTLEIKPDTINISFPIEDCEALSVESCINILNALKDRTGQDALTLTCHANLKTANTGRLYVNYVKLDAGTGLYVSCEQTDEGAMTIADAIIAKNRTIA